MLHYIYYPFPKTSADRNNSGIMARYEKKYGMAGLNKWGETAATHWEGKVLRYKGEFSRRINANDMLLICSHGNDKNSASISSGIGEQLSADDLATQLQNDVLSPEHVLIKMLSCYAGGLLKEEWLKKPYGAPQSLGVQRLAIPQKDANGTLVGESFFAKVLAEALRLREFHSILVGGYAGPLQNATIATKREGRSENNFAAWNRVGVVDGKAQLAHDHMHWFDGNGHEVSRDRITALKA